MTQYKIGRKKFHVSQIVISEDDRDDIKRLALSQLQDHYMGRYPDHVYEAIKAYGYTVMAADFGKSVEAVSKWFRLSRIPSSYLHDVAEKLNIPECDFIKEYRE